MLIDSLASLEGLPLRRLDLSYSDLNNLSFVRSLPTLEELRIEGTKVSDLSPLASLARLVNIDADGTLVRTLPEGKLPALRMLSVLVRARHQGTTLLRAPAGVSDSEAATFSSAHPKCQLRYRWEKALKETLTSTTRMRIRTGGTCPGEPGEQRTLLEVQELQEIKKVIDLIHIKEAESGDGCFCCGHPSLEFYSGQRFLLVLGFHHGRSLRWPDGWPGHGLLTDESGEKLSQWMADHGIKDVHGIDTALYQLVHCSVPIGSM